MPVKAENKLPILYFAETYIGKLSTQNILNKLIEPVIL